MVPEGEVAIDQLEVSSGHLYVALLAGGPSELRVFDLEGKNATVVPLLPVSSSTPARRHGLGDEVPHPQRQSFLDPPGLVPLSLPATTGRRVRTGLCRDVACLRLLGHAVR